jgi:hypothetical protein
MRVEKMVFTYQESREERFNVFVGDFYSEIEKLKRRDANFTGDIELIARNGKRMYQATIEILEDDYINPKEV